MPSRLTFSWWREGKNYDLFEYDSRMMIKRRSRLAQECYPVITFPLLTILPLYPDWLLFLVWNSILIPTHFHLKPTFILEFLISLA